MTAAVSPTTYAALKAAGLIPAGPGQTIGGPFTDGPITDGYTGQVAPSANEPPPDPDAYTPPEWYGTLRFALTEPGERGATVFGPRGSGKTTAVQRLAAECSRPLVTFQAARGNTIDDLMGADRLDNGCSVFSPGPLVHALQSDGWLLIEEANAMHEGVFSKLNTLLDGSGDSLALPDGTRLTPGVSFRVVLAFNPGYAGMQGINEALKDRLMPIFADYLPPDVEARMLYNRTGCPMATAQALVGFANNVRAARDKLGVDLSPRALMRLLRLMRACGMTWRQAFNVAILDLVGDPVNDRPARDAIQNIADAVGLMGWPYPKFS